MAMVSIRNLRKVYEGGFEALKDVSLDIEAGEILALLGPNGAGKTTLISAVCGITLPTEGSIEVGGHDVIEDYRAARNLIGLVPQEINLEPFEKVINTVRFSRGLFGKPRNDAFIEQVLRKLSLWDKRNARVMELSGGMKRRVLIAKALSHEPRVLFLDEPTAGVDVELRRDMWETVAELKRDGVTIILTTHYIEEAEAIADRVGVINSGRILLVEEKAALMARMGQKELRVDLVDPLTEVPASLAQYNLELTNDGQGLVYTFDAKADRTGIGRLMAALPDAGLKVCDVNTSQSSLEDIFVGLVNAQEQQEGAA
ncbi:ABC transporter ATP-binding protein [Pelagimonas varians]|uniref:Daunorubicin/doxorubicin resistance ATP-binding protein DrrA n=1 Tax=Pelagimonas varians TaxID=696760 RepID=A0A238KRH6_9RHOB|nr:ABC transporter ATP-binding protein [Pelagimonas varians]PYG28621.1 ABC-2 type transport system ATP-binding protein [Pelagimonas varians]SMX45433.1 Daunorubicin/doxorubicin resistance ATP-binding protein DrrA [Pelagimonas varians]